MGVGVAGCPQHQAVGTVPRVVSARGRPRGGVVCPAGTQTAPHAAVSRCCAHARRGVEWLLYLSYRELSIHWPLCSRQERAGQREGRGQGFLLGVRGSSWASGARATRAPHPVASRAPGRAAGAPDAADQARVLPSRGLPPCSRHYPADKSQPLNTGPNSQRNSQTAAGETGPFASQADSTWPSEAAGRPMTRNQSTASASQEQPLSAGPSLREDGFLLVICSLFTKQGKGAVFTPTEIPSGPF